MTIKSSFIGLILLLALTPFPAWTDDFKVIQLQSPILRLIPGQPIEWNWPDGRQARIFVRIYNPKYLEINADLTDNGCSNVTSATCKIRTAAMFFKVNLEWIANPLNPDRIGKVVEQGGGTPITVGFYGSMMHKRYYGYSYFQNMDNDQLICDQWKWLNETTADAPETLYTPHWWGENLFTNPETGVTENIVFGSISDVHWSKIDNRTLQVDRIDGRYTNIYGNLEAFIYRPVTAMLIQTSNNTCQAAFKPDIIDFNAKLDDMALKATQSIDYVYAQDDLYQNTIANSFSNGKFLFSDKGVPYEVR